jgi:hypothetical protein
MFTLFFDLLGWRALARLPPAQHLTAGKDPRDVNTHPRSSRWISRRFWMAQCGALPDHRKKDPGNLRMVSCGTQQQEDHELNRSPVALFLASPGSGQPSYCWLCFSHQLA